MGNIQWIASNIPQIPIKEIKLCKLIKIPLKEYEDSSFFDTINLANIAISGNGVRVNGILINFVNIIFFRT
jgi:hypothetical protein